VCVDCLVSLAVVYPCTDWVAVDSAEDSNPVFSCDITSVRPLDSLYNLSWSTNVVLALKPGVRRHTEGTEWTSRELRAHFGLTIVLVNDVLLVQDNDVEILSAWSRTNIFSLKECKTLSKVVVGSIEEAECRELLVVLNC